MKWLISNGAVVTLRLGLKTRQLKVVSGNICCFFWVPYTKYRKALCRQDVEILNIKAGTVSTDSVIDTYLWMMWKEASLIRGNIPAFTCRDGR
jgi:hypothetical protein